MTAGAGYADGGDRLLMFLFEDVRYALPIAWVVEVAEKPEFTPKNVQTRDERTKQIFWVKIEMPNPDGDLKPGMPGEATIADNP